MTANTPAVQEQRPIARREPKEKPIVQRGGFYKAGNKQVPDAMRTQKEANKKNIPIEIISTEQTEEYAEAVVRAWLPDHSQYTDDVVHHQFSVIRELKALEYLEKQVSGNSIYFRGSPIQMFQDLSKPFNKNGDPILTGVGYLKLLTEMARFKNFAIRDAVTKASRRAQLKLLNREWRNKEEIKAEKDEEKMVQDSINNEQQEKPERTTRPAPTAKRTISKPEKEKPKKRQVARTFTKSVENKEEEKPPEPKEPENTVDAELVGESYWEQLATENKTLDKVVKKIKEDGFDICKVNIEETSKDLLGNKKIKPDELKDFQKFLEDKEDQ